MSSAIVGRTSIDMTFASLTTPRVCPAAFTNSGAHSNSGYSDAGTGGGSMPRTAWPGVNAMP